MQESKFCFVSSIGVAEGNVRSTEEFLRIAYGNVDKLRDLRGNARRVNDFRHAVNAAVHSDARADLRAPTAYLCLVVNDLRIGKRHERDHGQGKELVDKDLVGD